MKNTNYFFSLFTNSHTTKFFSKITNKICICLLGWDLCSYWVGTTCTIFWVGTCIHVRLGVSQSHIVKKILLTILNNFFLIQSWYYLNNYSGVFTSKICGLRLLPSPNIICKINEKGQLDLEIW